MYSHIRGLYSIDLYYVNFARLLYSMLNEQNKCSKTFSLNDYDTENLSNELEHKQFDLINRFSDDR